MKLKKIQITLIIFNPQLYNSELCGKKLWHQRLAKVINSDDDFHKQIFELIFNLNFFAFTLVNHSGLCGNKCGISYYYKLSLMMTQNIFK